MKRLLTIVAGVCLLGLYAPEAGAEVHTCFGETPTIVGTPGNDLIKGTSGADVIWGDTGNDTIYGRGGPDLICGGRNLDRIHGQGGNDKLTGNMGYDRLHGGSGNDSVLGGPRDDRLSGGPGDDLLDGQTNIPASPDDRGDFVLYNHSPSPITASLTSGTATGEGTDTLTHIENMRGSDYNDTLTGDAGFRNLILGGGGDDTLSAGGGVYDNLGGGDGNDTLTGSDNSEPDLTNVVGHDTIVGEAGNDYIDGNGGSGDILVGGEGTNTMIGGSGGDDIYGDLVCCDNASGIDTIYGLGGDDHVSTSDGAADYVDAGAGTDTCTYDDSDTILNCP